MSAHQRIIGPFGMTFFLEEGYSGGDRPADPEEGLVDSDLTRHQITATECLEDTYPFINHCSKAF